MKTKRYVELKQLGEYKITVERIACNSYGNPRYNVTIFDGNNIFQGNWNITTYNINTDLEKLIEEIEK